MIAHFTYPVIYLVLPFVGYGKRLCIKGAYMPVKGALYDPVNVPSLALPFTQPPVCFKGNGHGLPVIGDLCYSVRIHFKCVARLSETVSAYAHGC